jgi:hypothetical protein
VRGPSSVAEITGASPDGDEDATARSVHGAAAVSSTGGFPWWVILDPPT